MTTIAPVQRGGGSRREVPPLVAGDRLSRDEFERRYHEMPHVKKAELIEGIVYMPSPVRLTLHGWPHSLLGGCIVYYISKTPGLQAGDNSTLRLDEDNEPQPDLLLRLPELVGGQSKIAPDGYLEGPVEFIAEVAASSASIDLHAKLNAYRRNRVREYMVWRTEDGAIDYFIFREGKYELLLPDVDGLLKSEVFPGLWLDPQALLQNDLPKLFQAIDKGVVTPEHAAFVERLKSK